MTTEKIDGVYSRAERETQRRTARSTPRADELILTWAEQFCIAIPTVFDKNGAWWLWNFDRYQFEEVDEIEVLNGFRLGQQLGDRTVRDRRALLDALRLVARENMPPDLPKGLIQFGSKFFNIYTQQEEPIMDESGHPRYFTTNAIPHTIAENEETPNIDNIFEEWVGQERKQLLFELIAYCCYRDYPLHFIFVMNGSGRNGKSRFLALLSRFLGLENCASTDLDRLTRNRFETYNLYRKLIATMGETDVSVLESTSLLKRLSGQDLVPFEAKGRQTFTAINYAKLLIATNSLPTSEDTSEGFYRRWLIVDFMHEFPEGRDVLERIPRAEYGALARKVTRLLPALLERGTFIGQGSIEQRKAAYIAASNPLQTFIAERCDQDDPDSRLRYSEVYLAYVAWLKQHKMRHVKKREFTRALEDAGLEEKRTTFTLPNGFFDKDRFIFGIAWKKASSTITHFTQHIQLASYTREDELKRLRNLRNDGTESEVAEFKSTFPSNEDICAAIKIYPEGCPREDLERLFPLGEELKYRVRKMLERGDIFERSPGVLGVLE